MFKTRILILIILQVSIYFASSKLVSKLHHRLKQIEGPRGQDEPSLPVGMEDDLINAVKNNQSIDSESLKKVAIKDYQKFRNQKVSKRQQLRFKENEIVGPTGADEPSLPVGMENDLREAVRLNQSIDAQSLKEVAIHDYQKFHNPQKSFRFKSSQDQFGDISPDDSKIMYDSKQPHIDHREMFQDVPTQYQPEIPKNEHH